MLIRGADGAPAYWQGIILDVSERVEATERIRMAEERFRQIVEHTPVDHLPGGAERGAFAPGTPLLYVSPQIEQLLGYPARAMGGARASGPRSCTPTTRPPCGEAEAGTRPRATPTAASTG